jgi:hypothetical protein
MRRLTTKLLGTLAATLALSAAAQAPTPPAAGAPGFFRPSPDPAITAFRPLPVPGAPVQPAATPPVPAQPAVADPELEARLQAEAATRARIEAQMDRIEAANLRAMEQAQAQAEVRPPVIASPLEGTARIMSPLDGTAPIVSPVSR